jgi:hypothetical protein
MSGLLDFVSPSLAREQQGFRPVARSAAEHLFRRAAATFVERDGWRIAVAVPGEAVALRSVGVADLSHLGKLEVRPACELHAPDGVTTYRISARRAFLLFAEPLREAVLRSLAGVSLALDVTGAYTVLAVSGVDARTLIGRLTHLHRFPSGGEVARVTAHVLPVGDGFRIVVAQDLGHYMAEVALDCARALGGGLVGVDALPEDERP